MIPMTFQTQDINNPMTFQTYNIKNPWHPSSLCPLPSPSPQTHLGTPLHPYWKVVTILCISLCIGWSVSVSTLVEAGLGLHIAQLKPSQDKSNQTKPWGDGGGILRSVWMLQAINSPDKVHHTPQREERSKKFYLPHVAMAVAVECKHSRKQR